MRIRSAAICSAVLLSGCGGGTTTQPPGPPPPPPPPPAPVAAVTVTPGTPTLVPGQAQALTAALKDAAGNALTGRAVSWASAADAVATVDGNGLVTAVARGTAQITATSEGRTGSATVTVLDGAVVGAAGGVARAPDSIVVTIPAGALAANRTITIVPVTSPPAHPRLIAGTAFELGPAGTTFAQPVTLEIRYPAGALPVAIDPANLRIHRYSGTAWEPLPASSADPVTRTVTGETTSFSTYAVIEVDAPVAVVEVGPGPATLAIGGKTTLTATLRDAANDVLTDRAVTWSSDAEAVATVSEAGVVTAVSPGKATITATSEGKSGSVEITVTPPATYASVSLGDQHGCAVGADGAAWCWGHGIMGDGTELDRGAPAPVTGGIAFETVKVSDGGSAGLTADGKIYSWGRLPGDGTSDTPLIPRQATLPGPASWLAAGGAGARTYCVIVQSEVYCWGRSLVTPSAPVVTLPTKVAGTAGFVAVEVGGNFACGLTSGGKVYCWGAALGNQVTTVATPTLVNSAEVFIAISAGADHVCAISAQHDAWCWGSGGGRLGDGSTQNRTGPVKVVGGHKFVSISGGDSHTCAITEQQEAWCWGYNYAGELGDGTRTARLVPVKVVGVSFQAIAAGSFATCGVSVSGDLYCWGSDESDMTADGTLSYALEPTKALLSDSVRRFSRQGGGACAVTKSSQVHCWGYLTGSGTPAPVVDGFVDVSVAGRGSLVETESGSACAIDAASKLYCWGANADGQLGLGDLVRRNAPTLALGGVEVSEVAMSENRFGCAIRAGDRKAICWGDIGFNPTPTPVVVTGEREVRGLSISANTVCAIEEGTAIPFCWNPGGTPAAQSAERYQSWSAGSSHRCGITEADVAKCVGSNFAGQLGDGTTTDRAGPVAVAGGRSFRVLAAGSGMTCGITTTDEPYCWGSNFDGQVGDGTRTNRHVPTRIAPTLSFRDVSVGDTGPCATTVAGDLHCWGRNVGGGLGAGRPAYHLTPRIVPAAVSFLRATR